MRKQTNEKEEERKRREGQGTCHVFGQIHCGKKEGKEGKKKDKERNRAPVTSLDRHTVDSKKMKRGKKGKGSEAEEQGPVTSLDRHTV